MKRLPLAFGCLLCIVVVTLGVGSILRGQAPATAQAPKLPKEMTSYRDVVKAVLPAIVSIDAKTGKPVGQPAQQGPGFGSGFLIDPKGVVVTNYHVVQGMDRVTVILLDGRKFVSKEIKGDRRSDLAIVRIEAADKKPFPALEFADSDAMEIGDRLLAFGAPFGLTGSVTSGILSAKGRSGLSLNMYEDFLQTDAAINPGNSGGPLVNLEGKVVGISSAIKSRTGGFQGVGLAIASNLAKSVVKSLESEGVVRRGYLGVQTRELTADVMKQWGLEKDGGVLVGDVYDKTPAAKAGLQTGDVITAVAGKKIKDGRALQALVADLPLGKPAGVAILRAGNSKVVMVTIEEQPEDFGVAAGPASPVPQAGVGIAKLGLEIADLTEQLADALGYRRDVKGVAVTGVTGNSVAANAGLRRGTLLLKVDRQAVASAAVARELLDKASLDRGILLQVFTPQGGTSFVLLQAN